MNDSFGSGELGSLTQAARGKQLKSARGILLFVGIITIIAQVVFGFLSEANIDKEISVMVAEAQGNGFEVDPVEVEAIRTESVRAAWISSALWACVGAVFIALGAVVYRFPIPATVAGLVLYIGCIAVTAMMDPTMIARGIIVKILIIVGLFKAVQAAIESEKVQSSSALEPLTAPS